MTQRFPATLIEQIIIHPQLSGHLTWEDILSCAKEQAEMSFYNGHELDDAYRVYGVDPAQGALVIIRPDGYVGVVSQLDDVGRIDAYLSRIIRAA